jgi:hypothetical protein
MKIKKHKEENGFKVVMTATTNKAATLING